MKINHKLLVFVLFVAMSILGRFLPHMWNMTPVGALAIVASLKLGLSWGLALPLVVLLVSDLFLGFYLWPIMLSVYLCTILYSLFGFLARSKKFGFILLGTSFSSLLFFIFTNMAVWAFGTMYPHNFYGLVSSYFMALPFFTNQFLGDLLFVSSAILLWELSVNLISVFRKTSLSKAKIQNN